MLPIIGLLSLMLVVMISIQIPSVQTKIAHYVIEELNQTFGTEISVDRLSIEFFGDVNLYGVSTKDDHGLEFINIPRLQAKLSLTNLIMEPDRIKIRKLNLYEPKIKIITYSGDSISNFIQLLDRFASEEEKSKSDFRLHGVVQIVRGELLIRNENLEASEQNWVDAKKLNLKVDNFKLENDDIWAELKELNFETLRRDELFVIDQIAANFHLSDQEMRFDALKIKTEDSDLTGHLVFSFAESADMAAFESKVNWDLALEENSKVNLKDIRYFVKDFDKNTEFGIMGLASGTLEKLVFKDLQLVGNGAYIAADELFLQHMTDGDKIVLQGNAIKAKTSYIDLVHALPSFIGETIPDFVNRFGTMDYKGNFAMDPDEIAVNAYVITALGDADLEVNLADYRSHLKYSGNVMASDINLKQIVEVDELGLVSGRLDFTGSGTDMKQLKIKADGNLAYLDLLGKRFNRVVVNGRVEKEQFKGYLSINDPQLKANYDGLFDFSKQPFHLDFTSQIDHLNLDYLGVTKELNAHVKANIEGDFYFSEIDDFIGSLEMDEVYFTSKKDTVNIAHAHIISSKTDDRSRLELDVPGYLKGEVVGTYKLSELPDAVANTLGSSALLTYTPKEVSPNQQFSFYFEFGQDLLSLLDERIEIASGTIVDGYVDTSTNNLMAELSSTGIGYDGFNVYNPLINIDTSKEGEQIYLRSDSLSAKGTMLYDVDIHTTPIQDSLLMSTNFKLGKEFPVTFDLNLFQTMNEDQNLVFGFSPSTILVDENYWHLNPENNPNSNRAIINFDKNYYELQHLTLESGDQRLLLDGYFENALNYKLNADLEQLVLANIIPKGLLGELKIDGIANGEIDILRTKDELKPLMQLKINELGLNEYGLGDLSLNGVYNVNENVFDLELYLEQKQVQVLYASGFIDNKPEKPEINMAASLDDLNFNFVESFLSAAMSNVRGMVSGNMNFSGPVESPDFNGMLDLRDLGFRVDFLNVDYSFDGVNTVPVAKKNGEQGSIALNGLNFRDTKYNTKGEVVGQLLFRDFASWFLNLSFNTPNLLVLDTKMSNNELFYGRVFGQGAFELFGPPERLDISAKAIVNDGSEFTINTGATKVESENKLVRFIPEAHDHATDLGPTGMNIDLDIKATAGTNVNLIFDPTSGDMVTANGSTESLKFKLNRAGAMSLDGVYTLDYGKYEFRQVPLLNRDFDIKPGSFVAWTGGGAFDATMDITANFEKTVSNVGEFLGAGYSQSYDVILGIVISESLANPQMDFTLSIPKGGSDIQSLIDYKFNLDPDDKMIQFGAVLLFGQFMTDTDAVLTAGATSTGAGIALKQLGGIINSLIAGGGVSIGMDYVTGSAMSGTSDIFKGNMKVDLSPRWTFNGAVGVPVGGGYSNETTTGEAEIEWDISSMMDKGIVVNFFTRPTNFGVQNFGSAGNFQSFGGGITYKTSFDHASEIFKKKRENPSRKLTKETEEKPGSILLQPSAIQDSVQSSADTEWLDKNDSIQEKPQSQSKINRPPLKNGLVRFK